MKNTVYVLTENDKFFGQYLYPWESLNVEILIKKLKLKFNVVNVSYSDICNKDIEISRSAVVVHSSSQQSEYKLYIDDALLYLTGCGINVIPSIHMTRAHENKGYQELYKKLKGLSGINTCYGAKLSEVQFELFKYPVVFKEISGFGSSGVSLVKCEDELKKLISCEKKYGLSDIKLKIRNFLGQTKRFIKNERKLPLNYGDYYKPMKRFIIQDFIPSLTFDYKIIIFHEAVFVLKRKVRDNDFKASGSGFFEYIEASDELLNFAKQIFNKFDEPYLSLDIVEHDGKYDLIEFQGVHFGPWTVINAEYCYVLRENKWEKVKKTGVIEDYLADSINTHILNILNFNSVRT